MKAIVSPSHLLKELKKLSLVIKKNPIYLMQSCVKFDFKQNKVTLTATDTETTIVCTLDCVCSNPFSVVIEYQDIAEVCSKSSLPLEISLAGSTIKMVSGKSKSSFVVLADEKLFTALPVDDFYFSFDAEGEHFYEMSIASSFSSPSDTRLLNCAIDFMIDKANIVGTDAMRLYKKEFQLKSGKSFVVTLPTNFVNCCKLFQSTKISVGEKFIKAEYNDEVVISRLSEQPYPNYKVILKQDIQYNMTINKAELKSALSYLGVSTEKTTNQAVINFEDGKIILTSQDIDFNKKSETEIEVEHDVAIKQIGLNASSFLQILNSISSEDVEISFSAPQSSIYIRPLGDETVLCLIQPLIIQ